MKKYVVYVALLICVLLFAFPSRTYAKAKTPIMGTGEVEAEQMEAYLMKNKSRSMNPKDRQYLKDFVAFCMQESESEGVRSDVVFALMMKETGFLNFGGDVAASQNNFGGIGATGNMAKGSHFKSPREGIRAVVQHLKCYASFDALNGKCVDPRFSEYLRGKAEYVEELGKRDNPHGVGWAVPGEGYGYEIVRMIDEMKSLPVSEIQVAEKHTEKKPSEKILPAGGKINFCLTACLFVLLLISVHKYLALDKCQRR